MGRLTAGRARLRNAPSSVICFANATFPPAGGRLAGAHGAPAGGHMGPPLRILTNGAGWTETPHPSRPSAVLSSPEGESSARRVVAPYKRPPPLWGRCPSVRTGAEGGKRPVCRNDSIYGCPPQSRLTARQLPRKGGAKAGRTLCAPTHLGGDQKIINFQFSILNF